MKGTVVVVGNEAVPQLTSLLANLGSRGLHMRDARFDELDPILHEPAEVALLVYETKGEGIAKRILQKVRDSGTSVPVVVVFDRAEKEDYYDLMSHGAYDFFELAERPECIIRSVCWAVMASQLAAKAGAVA